MHNRIKEAVKEKQSRNEVGEVQTFPVQLEPREINKNITISTIRNNKLSKEQIINKAITFHSEGNILEAAKYYHYFINHYINQGLNDHEYFSNYALILKDLGNFKEAELWLRKAIKMSPNFAGAHINLGGLLKDIGKLQEAEMLTRKAITLNSDLAAGHLTLGNILKEMGKLEEAELSYSEAIKLKPEYADAYLSLGILLRDIGQLTDAEKSTSKAIKLKPDLAKAYDILGLIHLQKSEYDLSLQSFSESANLLNGQINQEIDHKRFKTINQAKILHDIEQFEYLASQGYQTKKFTDLAILYKRIANKINWPSETEVIPLNNEYHSLLKESYNRLLHKVEEPELKDKAINNFIKVEKVTNDYFNHEYGLTYIDNFLSPEALDSLRKFLLGSTIWFNIRKNGYIGTFLREGLANPLILQIANELKNKFPKIFKDYPINEIWAFKYDSRSKNDKSSIRGINAHADFAAVNVNFWITPNDANLDTESGGLIVYDVEAPKDWDFNTYNNNQERILEELKKSKGNTRVISYKENRAVIFNSNLFHETDNYLFKEGYENRRINITMLFGKRNQS